MRWFTSDAGLPSGADIVLCEEHRLGWVAAEQEYQFGDNAHGPDISFIGPAKEATLDWDRRVQPFVPDLAVEVVSKNDSFGSIVKKAHRYLQYGTREVWVFSIASHEVFSTRQSGTGFCGTMRSSSQR